MTLIVVLNGFKAGFDIQTDRADHSIWQQLSVLWNKACVPIQGL